MTTTPLVVDLAKTRPTLLLFVKRRDRVVFGQNFLNVKLSVQRIAVSEFFQAYGRLCGRGSGDF
jgi:hypothetical protein